MTTICRWPCPLHAEVHVVCSIIDPGHGRDMARPYTQKLLDTTACQRLKVMVRVVCRDLDAGQEVSVRVRTSGNLESAVAQIHINVFSFCFLWVFLVDDRHTVSSFHCSMPKWQQKQNFWRSYAETIFAQSSIRLGLKLGVAFVMFNFAKISTDPQEIPSFSPLG